MLCDKPRANSLYGGTAIYIKNHTPHYTVPTTPLNFDHYTGIVLELPLKIKHNFAICKTQSILPCQDITHWIKPQQYAFIADYFNVHNRERNCFSTSTRRISLHNLISNHHLSLHVPTIPTHIPRILYNNLSIIGFAVSKKFYLPY